MTVVSEKIGEQIGNWLELFTAQPPAEPWRQELREAAFERFCALGFPTTHNEEWRFTNVAEIARDKWSLAPQAAADVDTLAPWTAGGIRLVFVNGRLAGPVPSLPKGVEAGLLAEPSELNRIVPETAFTALNTAFLDQVAWVKVARGMAVDSATPIHLVYIAAADEPAGKLPYIAPRMLIQAGADAHVTVIESFVGAGTYFTNAVTEIVAGQGAVVDHYKVQRESLDAYHVAALEARLGRDANFRTHSISLGGKLVRNDAGAVLSEGTEAVLNGLYIVNGSQHVDNHTVIDHAKPHGTSHELYKGILDGESAAVFNGKIIVRQDAQKTDSKQTNKNLVLSDNSVVNTKPELQIWADDVRCTHGATIGQLDAEALFYMQSRGIGRSEARRLLTYAFAQDIVDRIKVESLRDSLEKLLFEKFHERSEH
ncbi:MAG: Fe-S cluster assembly protein SufD [Bryobacteraceae bacterium]|jgi:Fe-S cluster assembly protein SufD